MLLATPLTARAAPVEPDTATKAKAREFVLQGQQALRAKRFRQALRYFNDAYRLWPRKEILFNLALVYHQMNRKIAAAIHLRKYLKNAGPAARDALPKMLERLLSKVCVLRVQASHPRITIWIDGRKVGSGSAEVVLLPGGHAAEIRDVQRVLARLVLTLRGGQEYTWKPPPLPPPQPRVITAAVPVAPSKRLTWQRLHWAYFAIAAGLTLATGAAAVGSGLKTNELEREFQANQTEDLASRGLAYKVATNALIGVTALAGVGAVVLAVFTRWRRPERSSRPMVLPAVTANGAAVILRWQH